MHPDLLKILGSNCRRTHLKPWVKRFRAYTRAAQDRQPIAYLLETADGRRFKLLFAPAGNRHLAKLKSTLPFARDLAFFPRCVFEDESHLLFEYVEGVLPDFSTAAFARGLAQGYAAVHALQLESRDVEEYLIKVRRGVDKLGKAMSVDLSGVLAHIERHAPAKIHYSLDYCDIKPGNFIENDAGVHFIDFGALKAEQAAGAMLFASPAFQQVDKAVFFDAYEAAGGPAPLRAIHPFLRLAHLIMLAAFNEKKRKKVVWWDVMLRRRRRRRRDQLTQQLLREFATLS